MKAQWGLVAGARSQRWQVTLGDAATGGNYLLYAARQDAD